MQDDPWLDEIRKYRDAIADSRRSMDDDDTSAEPPRCDETMLDFFEQIVRGDWPVKMPLTLEIYAEGSEPRIRPLSAGQTRRAQKSHVVTLILEFDRTLLKALRQPRDPAGSKLPQMAWLTRVDRECFLETAAAHFADILAGSDDSLRRDPWLVEFLREIHDYDQELVPDLVAETIKVDRAAGRRLRDVILDITADPRVCERLGWLVVAGIADRVQDL